MWACFKHPLPRPQGEGNLCAVQHSSLSVMSLRVKEPWPSQLWYPWGWIGCFRMELPCSLFRFCILPSSFCTGHTFEPHASRSSVWFPVVSLFWSSHGASRPDNFVERKISKEQRSPSRIYGVGGLAGCHQRGLSFQSGGRGLSDEKSSYTYSLAFKVIPRYPVSPPPLIPSTPFPPLTFVQLPLPQHSLNKLS